jgi:hypothetical protein
VTLSDDDLSPKAPHVTQLRLAVCLHGSSSVLMVGCERFLHDVAVGGVFQILRFEAVERNGRFWQPTQSWDIVTAKTTEVTCAKKNGPGETFGEVVEDFRRLRHHRQKAGLVKACVNC